MKIKVVLFLFISSLCFSKEFKIIDNGKPVNFYISDSTDPLVKWAVSDLINDVEQICGQKPKLIETTGVQNLSSGILIGLHNDNLISKSIKSNNQFKNKWETTGLVINKNKLVITGSDVRGTVYAVFELAKRVGISPWKWWADVALPKSQNLSVDIKNGKEISTPSVKYRGIFLNDEDWGLQEWAEKTFEKEIKDIGPKTYEKIFQLLLRLKANTIWPAMHPCTKAFYKIAGNNEMAEKYHIVVGSSHCEPMLRNNVYEWKKYGKGDFNYFTNKQNVQNYWKERVVQVKNAENITTLGMRGIHDGHMHGGKNLEEKTRMVEKIIDDQRRMLVDVKKKEASKIATTIVLYKEVLDLYNKGMKIPEDVTIMWCDDNHGYIRRRSNLEEQKRSGGSGVYYHLSYWGKPHDYLWLSTTQPALIWYEMSRAYQNGAKDIWIANVGDIKPAEYDMEFFLDLAWDINSVNESNIHSHTQKWSEREFGKKLAKEIADIKTEYYRLASIRRPEFMGWSGVEPKTNTTNTEFNNYEIQNRLALYEKLEKRTLSLSKRIRSDKKAAWFQLVEYPVICSALMNYKFLFAQLSNAERNERKRQKHIERSISAHNKISNYTSHYNHKLKNGKWNKMMSMEPRGLNVFKLPNFIKDKKAINKGNKNNILVLDGANYHSTNQSGNYNWRSINGLGYSNASVSLFPLKSKSFESKKPSITYEFESKKNEEVEIKIMLLPTHVNDRNQAISVNVDGEKIDDFKYSTKGRSKQWKKNTLRNHAIVSFKHKLSGSSKHKIEISSNQTGIVIDQIAIVFAGDNYYMAP
jgi:hypothetical protein